MEILTLLKANIIRKKGSFIGILILMLIISAVVTTILSVKRDCAVSLESAYELADNGEIVAFFTHESYSKQLVSDIKENANVGGVDDYNILETNYAEMNGMEISGVRVSTLMGKEKLINDEFSGYEDVTPTLKKGEIYVPQGLLTNLGGSVGEKIKIVSFKEYEFTIKGIVLDPMLGSSFIGAKTLYICDEDYKNIVNDYRESGNFPDDFDGEHMQHMLYIHKSDDCTMSDAEFSRELAKATGVIDKSFMVLTKSDLTYYTTLVVNIISSILMVFMVLMVIVMLIVMGHSISSTIEMDYESLGVLKSQGFTKGRIRAIFILQYLLAEIIGAIIGTVCALPLIYFLGNLFESMTAIVAQNRLYISQSLFIVLGIMLVSAAFTYLITRKVARISPVRAISGGRNEIYFDSRIKAPISKRCLGISLALRQFTSAKRRYVGTIIISAILVAFMMMTTLMVNSVTSKSALESMGEPVYECAIAYDRDKCDDATLKRVENIIDEYCGIERKYSWRNTYIQLNNDKIMAQIWYTPESLSNFMLRGREPKYDNELIITEILSENYGYNIGDTVTLKNEGRSSEYIITGFYQVMNDAGRVYAITGDGAKKLGIENDVSQMCYSLKDTARYKELNEKLQKEYGDQMTIEIEDSKKVLERWAGSITDITSAVNIIIYVFSVVFTIIVMVMVCGRLFLQERRNIGIYKAMGFTSRSLRLGFALRFLIVAIFGTVIGELLCAAFANRILSVMLKSIGITSLITEMTPLSFIIPAMVICICFFTFAYLASGKVKRVEARELMYE